MAGLLLGAGLLLVWLSCWPRHSGPRPRSRWRERTQDLLVRAGAPGVSPGRLVAASTALAAVVLLITLGATASPPIAACFGLIAAGVPAMVVKARARRRQVELRSVWPEVVDDLISAIRAGLSLPEALTSLGERGPVELRPQFRRFADDYRVTGHFAESLDRLKAHLADPVADRIIEALRITQEVGGSDLVRLLRTLGRLLRRTCAPAGSSRRASRGRWAGPAWPPPRRGRCSCCSAVVPRRLPPSTRPSGSWCWHPVQWSPGSPTPSWSASPGCPRTPGRAEER